MHMYVCVCVCPCPCPLRVCVSVCPCACALCQCVGVPLQVREPHPDVGDWWSVYDYGLDTIRGWAKDYKHPYPGQTAGPRF